MALRQDQKLDHRGAGQQRRRNRQRETSVGEATAWAADTERHPDRGDSQRDGHDEFEQETIALHRFGNVRPEADSYEEQDRRDDDPASDGPRQDRPETPRGQILHEQFDKIISLHGRYSDKKRPALSAHDAASRERHPLSSGAGRLS